MNSIVDWHQRAAALRFRDRAWIDGKWCAARSGETFCSINPATGQLLAEVASCDAADVDLAVITARRAFEDGRWSRLAPQARKQALQRLAALMLEHREELALLDSLNMGKPVTDAHDIDVPGAAGVFAWYAEAIDKRYGEVAPTPEHAVATITREPIGVIGAVVPWNFPLDMAAWKVAPALAAGNSVVLKPAEQSPLSALRLAELAVEAGIPAGVFNVVPGLGETAGRALGLHPDVDCLVFTGSTEIGKLFQQYAGQSNMKQVWLECGGKSANLVFADCADLDRAAERAAFGIFFNQGEVCSASSRLLVERSIHDRFVDKLITRARALRPGDPLDPATRLGAIVDERQTRRILDYVGIARCEGATLACGGQSVQIGGSGNFIEPTIFTGVDNTMRIAQEEVFGPVLAVIPFDTEEEAIRIANDSPYGLAAAVWTDSLTRAHRVARRLNAGTISVNTVDALDVTIPFGGNKQSGFGRDLSLHALDKYTQLKTTWIQVA